MFTYIAQYCHSSWISAGNNQDIDGQIQQYSSCSNDVVEVGTSEPHKSGHSWFNDIIKKKRKRVSVMPILSV